MLITDQNSVYFNLLHLFGLVQSTSVQLSPIHSIRSIRLSSFHLVHFGLFRSNLVNSVQFGLFGPVCSIWFTLVYFSQFGPIRSTLVHSFQFSQFRSNLLHRSNSVSLIYSIHLGIFGPIFSIQSTLVYLVHLVHFKSLRSNSVFLLKNRKIKVWVE